jgi:hypothetical protein
MTTNYGTEADHFYDDTSLEDMTLIEEAGRQAEGDWRKHYYSLRSVLSMTTLSDTLV